MQTWEAHKAQAVMESLLGADDVGAAMRALALRADDASAESFERYAGSALRSAGIVEATETGTLDARIERIADGQLVRLLANPWIKDGKPLRAIEDTINRLLGVSSALAYGIGSHTPERGVSKATLQREIYEIQGLDYPLWSNPLRGSHVILPPASLLQESPEAYFREIDWRMLDCVASIAHLCYQSTLLANSNQRVYGVKGPHSSEWDVRTRLASALGNLWTSLRADTRFDCDLSRNTAAVRFTVPPLSSFPAATGDGPSPHPANGLLEAARAAYCLRLAALIAATCFGAGRSVERAFVIGMNEQSQPVISCSFDRRQFVHETLPAIDSGEASNPALRFEPTELQAVLSASRSEFDLQGTGKIPSGKLVGCRIDPLEDERILPADMQRFFHAKRVCDIGVSDCLEGAEEIIAEARKDSTSMRIAAIARLEGLVDELERSLKPPADQPDARPLFCETALQRAAVILLDEDLSIAADAEAFLSFEEDEPSTLPDVYYYRAPGALFHARRELAAIHRKTGDMRSMEAQANRLIALSPTAAAGYSIKSDALARQGRVQQAANVIIDGIRVAVNEADQGALLFSLSLLFGNLGLRRESDALLICASTLPGPHAGKALDMVEGIANGAPAHAFALANLPDARAAIAEAGVPLVSDRIRNALIARAALGLANAHAPLAAAPYIEVLRAGFPGNRAILSACDSIINGL